MRTLYKIAKALLLLCIAAILFLEEQLEQHDLQWYVIAIMIASIAVLWFSDPALQDIPNKTKN